MCCVVLTYMSYPFPDMALLQVDGRQNTCWRNPESFARFVKYCYPLYVVWFSNFHAVLCFWLSLPAWLASLFYGSGNLVEWIFIQIRLVSLIVVTCFWCCCQQYWNSKSLSSASWALLITSFSLCLYVVMLQKLFHRLACNFLCLEN